MTKRILQKVSFGLARTNPKLTTNIKLVVDSSDKIFLESFDEVEELSDSRFKGYKVSGGTYAHDLYRFYDNGKFPKEIAYSPVIKDNTETVKAKFQEQFDMTYNAGAYTKVSKLYDEEFAMFAPLWIEPLNIPDYFVIFKNPNPVSINTKNSANDALGLQADELNTKPDNLYDTYVKTSKIHAVIDLTENSNIGRYIRRHASDELFPEAPLSVNFNRNQFTKWNGISMDRGEMTSKSVFFHEDLLIRDKTIMELENLITNGFQNNAIVCANVLNLEFLFDDIEAENYEINRYFGFYCNAEDIGKFKLDGDALFDDRVKEANQLPKPLDRIIGYEDNLESQIQTNENGIKIYANRTSGIIPRSSYFSDSTNPRFGFVKDKNGKLYSIKNGGSWENDTQIRIDETRVDWQDFTGFTDSVDSISAKFVQNQGRPHCTIEVVNNPDSGDQIRFRYTYNDLADYTTNSDLVETHTIVADSSLAAGKVNNRSYSSNGTIEEVATAIRKAINNIVMLDGENEIFRAYENGSKVIVYSRFVNSLWNKITVQSYKGFVQNTLFVYGTTGQIQYSSAIGATYATTTVGSPVAVTSGYLASTTFGGGKDNIKSLVVIDADDAEAFTLDRYLKTENGYSKIKGVHSYTDSPVIDPLTNDIKLFKDFDKYRIVEIEDENQNISINSGGKVTLYETVENGTGFLSFYPVKDFDFDFHNDDYTRDADSNTGDLLDYLAARYNAIGGTGYAGGTGSTAYGVLENIIGPSSLWQTEQGFIRLAGIVDEDTGALDENEINEYERLKENENSDLVLASRVVPFINKWVYDDLGKDVRENGYRLNVSEAFRYSNFSPSFKHFLPDPKFYTHEWYYLQQYPDYMSASEKADAFSYFDTEFDITDLYNATEDKFLDYFTQDNSGTDDFPTKFKYSIFSGGDDVNDPTTFFRGVKVRISERADKTQTIDFNINDIKTKSSDKFNNYKFSALLTFNDTNNISYKIIENEKFKNITLVIGIGLTDDLFMPGITGPAGNRFIDRTMLYTMTHKYDIDKLDTVGPNFDSDDDVYADIEIAGSFELYPPSGPYPIVSPYPPATPEGTYWRVNAINGADGSVPNLTRDIVPGVNGKFQDIEIVIDGGLPQDGTVIFRNIVEVEEKSILCEKIIWIQAGTSTETDITTGWITGWPYTSILKQYKSVYKGGGFNSHLELMKDISFASLADKINRGNPEIKYIHVDSTGATSISQDFILELLEPEQELKVSTFGIEEDLDRPTIFSTTSESIGTRMKFLNRSYVKPITRYNGNYSPRTVDIIHYINDVNTLRPALISQYNSIGATADVDDIIDNVTFGIYETGFGYIPNMYYYKVNENNPKGLLELNRSGGFRPVYPKIGEIAIDYRDYNVFLSNWDVAYFREHEDKNTPVPVVGTRSMLEKRSFYGSKIMNLPETIQLESFDHIDIDDPIVGGRELFLPSTQDYDVVSRIVNTGKNATLTGNIGRSKEAIPFKPFTNPSRAEFWVYLDKAIEKYLIADGITDVFTKYINPAYSIGLKDSIDDDVKAYIKDNILRIYEIDTIELYELRYWKNPNNFSLIEFGLDDLGRKLYNFEQTKNFTTSNLTNSNLNFKLIYNIPTERKSSSISLKVTLRKK